MCVRVHTIDTTIMESANKMIYFDNNATTIAPPKVLRALLEWSNKGNPSSGYASAKECRDLMYQFRVYVGKLCSINTCCEEPRDSKSHAELKQRLDDPSNYKVIFTSGASESNCTILRSVVDAYREHTDATPHVVLSAIEHKSLIEQAQSFEKRGLITATYVQPNASGHIPPEEVARAIQPNTCLVCVMHANNETGAINNIRKIGEIAHKNNVPYHCDTVQTFGKFPISPITDNVDSFCISFHKMGGVPGIGALVVKQKFLQGYKLSPLIFGTQNEGLRGGTENMPGIGAAHTALKIAMENRSSKNMKMAALKKYIMTELGKRIPTKLYPEYLADQQKRGPKNEVEIVFLSGQGKDYLPNTILLSVVKRSEPKICNGKMKTALEKLGIIVSVGSACNTASPKASHVLYSMGADEYIRKGTLRISLGDTNTEEEAQIFVREFLNVIKQQLSCE